MTQTVPVQDSVSRFLLTVANGAITGTEEYRLERTPEGWRLTSHSTVQRTDGRLEITQVQTLDADRGPVRYRLDVTTPTGPQMLEAWGDGDTVRLQASSGARTQRGQVALRPRTLILDNLIVSHYQVLIDLFDATPDTSRRLAWQFVVPQVVTAVRGTVSRELPAGGLVKYSIDVAGTLVEIWADDASRRLMRVSVPLQQVEMVRVGFTMPAATPPRTPPAGTVERELTFVSAGLTFPATLAVPAHPAGRVPVVVLVHGSGPNDRDETIGPNKPFRDIAWALAGNGIATLRYDKRTFAFRGMGDARTITVDEEVIDDAAAAVRFARTLPEVDTTRVYLLGHSLGGTLAPLIAEQIAPSLAGLILLAPGARPLDEAILDQVGTRLRLTGQPEAAVTRQVEELRTAFARVRSGVAPDSEMVFGAPARYWRDLQGRRPLEVLQRLTIPVLVLQGGNDYQVTKADYDLVQQALAAKPEAARQSHWFPNLNHLFIQATVPSTGTEYGRSGAVDARVITAIARWIGAVR